MSENSKIEWTDHTFNPWEGCTKVSPGCAHCYAEARDVRFTGGVHWGKGAPRRRTSAANWKLPLKWNRAAEKGDYKVGVDLVAGERLVGKQTWNFEGRRPRVFCASLADWLDDEVPIEWLADLLALIYSTPHLDWLLLTKRPENWKVRLVKAKLFLQEKTEGTEEDLQKATKVAKWIQDWLSYQSPANVWIGTTVENQEMADKRIPLLLLIPAKVRFLSCEPLLGPLEIIEHLGMCCDEPPVIDWVICGGESGKDARPMHPDWARDLREQCEAAGAGFFFKQWGEWSPNDASPDLMVPIKAVISGKPPNERGDLLFRVGKKAAGRLLDGREHNEFPWNGKAL